MVPQVVACCRKASSACTRSSLGHVLTDYRGLTQGQVRSLYSHPYAEWERQGLRAMVGGKAVEDRHPQIAQDIENDVFHAVWEVAVRLNALHTPKHQTPHPLENAS